MSGEDPVLSSIEEELSPEETEAMIAEVMEAFHLRLQESGRKSTTQRDLITERFFRLDKHITADELLEDVKSVRSSIGYATVYRTLKLLVDEGFAVPKDFGDGLTRYDPVHDQDPHHDHLICVDCRKIIEFGDDEVSARVVAIAQAMGYELRRKQLEVYAECRIEGCPNREG